MRMLGTGRVSGVLSYFTRHPTAANLILVMMVIAGLFAAPKMRAQFFPDIEINQIIVNVAWEGAGPEDVDAGIVAPLQPALLDINGLSESNAKAQQGRAQLYLEFEPGVDMAQAQQDVQAAVDGVTTLPAEADEPVVNRRVWRDRVTDVVITGPVSVDQLARYADEYVAALYREGITRTILRGFADPEIMVRVDTLSLIRHNLSLAQIAAAIRADMDSRPAGILEGANARVRTGATRRSADEIANVVLRERADGAVLRLGDVAEVSRSLLDRNRAYYVGQDPAVTVRVDRVAGGDALDIREIAAKSAAEISAGMPEGTSAFLIRTRADAIAERLAILLDNAAMGLALVLLLLFLFLNARTALWVAAGIPVALLAAVAGMYPFGLSLNMVSLFGLIITLGIVVDDAIVVAEHADARARRLGEPPHQAAERAARRMALPVFTATITTIIAFWSLTAIGGRFGTMVRDIPLTVVVVLLASLVECFLILPHHMAHALKHTAKEHWYDWPSRQVNRGFRAFREAVFRPFMRLVVRARYVVASAAIALLVSQVIMLISGDVPWRFFNAPERGSVTANIAMLPGASRAETDAQLAELERAVKAVGAGYEAEYGRNPVDFILREIGGNAGRGLSGAESKTPDELGGISVELIDADERPYSSFDFVYRLRNEVRQHPMTETLSFRRGRSGPGGDSLDVALYGRDSAQLKAAAERLKSVLAAYPEVSALEDDLAHDRVELILELTDRGAALGFTVEGLGQELRGRLNGIEAASFPAGPRSGAVRVEVPDSEKTADFLQGMLIRSPSGADVPLVDLVSLRQADGYSVLRRENGQRVVTVSGDISEDDPARAQEIIDELRDVILPELAQSQGITWELGGLAEQERSFLNDAGRGFILCLIGIFLALAWIFASWTRPFAIMAIIPFGLVGAIWGHALWDVPMSMFSVVGLIGMTGIIINDSIVLISAVDEHSRGRALIPAVIEATCDRLRPVVLTTLTTVLGLAPLLYEGSQQAQFLRPTVIALVYGLGFGMLLVLLLVPALLVIGHDIQRNLRSARRILAGGALLPRQAHRAIYGFAMSLCIWGAAVLTPALSGWGAQALPEILQRPGGAVMVFMLGALLLSLLFRAALLRPRS
ncbi:MAG: efflux RND transporter permease subunit [Mangrovicoccus sp.]|nr:efflux RND transporter permease subunit [Mangrovicoccus sp.]